MMSTFHLPIRVYYEDTDAGGVVYHANYLSFMERTRTELLREMGMEQDQLMAQHDTIFAVVQADVTFHQSARFNQLLDSQVNITAIGKVKIEFDQRIYHNQSLVIAAKVTVVALSASRHRAVRVPDWLLQMYDRWVKRTLIEP